MWSSDVSITGSGRCVRDNGNCVCCRGCFCEWLEFWLLHLRDYRNSESLIRPRSKRIRETTSHHSQPIKPIGAKGNRLLSLFSLRVWRGSGHFNWRTGNRVDLRLPIIGRISILCFSFERKQIHCTVLSFCGVECVLRICGL